MKVLHYNIIIYLLNARARSETAQSSQPPVSSPLLHDVFFKMPHMQHYSRHNTLGDKHCLATSAHEFTDAHDWLVSFPSPSP